MALSVIHPGDSSFSRRSLPGIEPVSGRAGLRGGKLRPPFSRVEQRREEGDHPCQ